MALYRNVQTSFWTDVKVSDDFTPEDRYFYLYLFTNPHTNLCGCYELSVKQAALETGYTVEKVDKLIKRLENAFQVIQYNKETRELIIVKWFKYNWTSSGDFRKALFKEINNIKCPEFKEYLTNLCNGEETVLKPLADGGEETPTVTDTKTDSSVVSLNEKRFEEFWKLYPRKEGKGAARKKWDQISPNAELFDKIITAIQDNINNNAQWKKDNGQYIPHPTTWLNQGRWDDVINESTEQQTVIRSTNQFQQFEQRKYTPDAMAELERRKLGVK